MAAMNSARECGEELGTVVAEAVHRTAADEAFTRAAIETFAFDAFQEIRHGREGAALLPGFDDGFDGILSDVLDGIESEEDFISADGKIGFGEIDIRCGDFHTGSSGI